MVAGIGMRVSTPVYNCGKEGLESADEVTTPAIDWIKCQSLSQPWFRM